MEELEVLSCGGRVKRTADGTVSYTLLDPENNSLEELAEINDISVREAAHSLNIMNYLFSIANWKEVCRTTLPYVPKKYYIFSEPLYGKW